MSALSQFLKASGELYVGQSLYLAAEALPGHLAKGRYLLTGMAEVRGTITARLLRVTSLEPFATEHPAVAVSWPKAKINAYTGAALPHSALVQTNKLIAKFFEHIFKQGGKPELFDPKFDWDKFIVSLSEQCFRKFPFHLDDDAKYDFIMEVLHQTVTAALVKNFKDDGAGLQGYFGRMFKMRMITALQTEAGRRKKQKFITPSKDDDRTDDEQMDSLRGPSNETENELDYKALMTSLVKFLGKKPEAKYFLAILQYSPQGLSNTELAQKIGVSPTAISRYLDRFKAALIEYAKATDDDAFLTMIQQYTQTKKHSPNAGVDPVIQLITDLKNKKVKTSGADSKREPAGQVTNIRVKSVPDVLNDEYLAKLVLSDRVTQSTIDTAAEEFMDMLTGSDDVVKAGNRLFTLSIDAAEIKSLKSR